MAITCVRMAERPGCRSGCRRDIWSSTHSALRPGLGHERPPPRMHGSGTAARGPAGSVRVSASCPAARTAPLLDVDLDDVQARQREVAGGELAERHAADGLAGHGAA